MSAPAIDGSMCGDTKVGSTGALEDNYSCLSVEHYHVTISEIHETRENVGCANLLELETQNSHPSLRRTLSKLWGRLPTTGLKAGPMGSITDCQWIWPGLICAAHPQLSVAIPTRVNVRTPLANSPVHQISN